MKRIGTRCLALTLSSVLAACNAQPPVARDPSAPNAITTSTASTGSTANTPFGDAPPWVEAARQQVGITVHYDAAYVVLPYPGGDVPIERGVCTDVVIRALRSQGLDLQQRLHEDMRRSFGSYPQNWGLKRPDRNIDHRRVPNLETWFSRQGWQLANGNDYRAGDLVSWRLPGGAPHIGIVSDRHTADGQPLILHNINRGTREEAVLHAWPINGHFRPAL